MIRVHWVIAACIVWANLASAEEPLRFTLEFAGEEREYFVRLPADYEPKKTYWPLVSVHGGNGNGRTHFLAGDVRRFADELGLKAIVVSPSFSNSDFLASRFPSLGEGAFLLAVLEDLRGRYDVHPRILLTGYSRGGQFTHRFAFAHSETVAAVATFAAGTWTTPDGQLLVESVGLVEKPEAYLLDKTNASQVPERLQSMFIPRVATVAGTPATEDARDVPFLVMCGTFDPRLSITREFVASLERAGFLVEAAWPRTPHGGRSGEEYREDFFKYSRGAVEFFLDQVAKEK